MKTKILKFLFRRLEKKFSIEMAESFENKFFFSKEEQKERLVWREVL